jgi:hypothetical protein
MLGELTVDLDEARAFLRQHHRGVLATRRVDIARLPVRRAGSRVARRDSLISD